MVEYSIYMINRMIHESLKIKLTSYWQCWPQDILWLDVHSSWHQGAKLLDPFWLSHFQSIFALVENFLNSRNLHVAAVVPWNKNLKYLEIYGDFMEICIFIAEESSEIMWWTLMENTSGTGLVGLVQLDRTMAVKSGKTHIGNRENLVFFLFNARRKKVCVNNGQLRLLTPPRVAHKSRLDQFLRETSLLYTWCSANLIMIMEGVCL